MCQKSDQLKNRWTGKEELINKIIDYIKNRNDTWPTLLKDLDYVDEIEGKRDLRGIPLVNYTLEDIVFKNINFQHANFQNANLANASFVNIDLRCANLSNSVLLATDFQTADLRNAIIANITINEATDFGPHFEWVMEKRKRQMSRVKYIIKIYLARYLGYKGKIYSEQISKTVQDYREAKQLYRSLRSEYKNLDRGFSDYFYYREWHCELSLHPSWHPAKWFGVIWEKISCSGTAPLRFLIFIFVTILIFSTVYYIESDGIIRTNDKGLVVPLNGFGQALYFSTITYTTLGYGDFHPNHDLKSLWWLKYICSAESIIGVLSLAAAIAIFLQFMRKD